MRIERRPIAPGLDCESCGKPADFDNRPELPPLPLEREPRTGDTADRIKAIGLGR